MSNTIRRLLLSVCVLLVGCSDLPSVKSCSKVTYMREGAAIIMQAECSAL